MAAAQLLMTPVEAGGFAGGPKEAAEPKNAAGQ